MDDHDFNILALKQSLETHYPYEIFGAENGQIAVQMFEESMNKQCGCPNRTFRLIFMDINMPVLGGIEAATEIEQLLHENTDETCNLPVTHIVANTSNQLD